jgi:hypothetical protein
MWRLVQVLHRGILLNWSCINGIGCIVTSSFPSCSKKHHLSIKSIGNHNTISSDITIVFHTWYLMQPFNNICWIEYTLMEGFVTRPIWYKLVVLITMNTMWGFVLLGYQASQQLCILMWLEIGFKISFNEIWVGQTSHNSITSQIEN